MLQIYIRHYNLFKSRVGCCFLLLGVLMCAGGAVDITIDGVLDDYNDGYVQQGLVDIFPYLNAQGLQICEISIY